MSSANNNKIRAWIAGSSAGPFKNCICPICEFFSNPNFLRCEWIPGQRYGKTFFLMYLVAEKGVFIGKILGGDFSIGDSCHPKNLDGISDKINLRVLLEKGDEQ